MKKILNIMFLVYITGWIGCSDRESQLVRELNQEIRALPEGSPSGYEDGFIEGLVDWDKYPLIGLGEATHGTKDFFELKQRLFRFLVEEHGCRIFAYEYSYRKSLLVNEYIHHRYHQLDSLFQDDLWIQDNESLRKLVRWMRKYNNGKEESECIHFIGIDNQLDAMRLEEVIDQIEQYVPSFRPDQMLFHYNLPGKRKATYPEMTEDEYLDILNSMDKLEIAVKSAIVSGNGALESKDTQVALRLIGCLQDSHEFLYRYFADGENLRDQQLAMNVLKIAREQDFLNPVVVWAHNAHVARNPHYYQEDGPSMGYYLNDSFQEGYLSVATSFSRGAFTAVMLDSIGNDTPPMTCRITDLPPDSSLNRLFCMADEPQFVLNIRKLDQETALHHFLNEERPMIGVGDLYLGSPEQHFTGDRMISLVRAHDLLFYFSDTKAILPSY